MKKDYATLSERPEDQALAIEWAEEQIQKQKRNKEIGDEVRSRVAPFIREIALKHRTVVPI